MLFFLGTEHIEFEDYDTDTTFKNTYFERNNRSPMIESNRQFSSIEFLSLSLWMQTETNARVKRAKRKEQTRPRRKEYFVIGLVEGIVSQEA